MWFWFGILAPAGTPKPVIAKLNAELTAVINEPEVKARFAQQSIEVVSGTSEAFGDLIETETRHWHEVVKTTGTKQE